MSSRWQDKPKRVEFETLTPDEYYDVNQYRIRIRIGDNWQNIQFTDDTNRYQLANLFNEMAHQLRWGE